VVEEREGNKGGNKESHSVMGYIEPNPRSRRKKIYLLTKHNEKKDKKWNIPGGREKGNVHNQE
jgi:hypothetical protein